MDENQNPPQRPQVPFGEQPTVAGPAADRPADQRPADPARPADPFGRPTDQQPGPGPAQSGGSAAHPGHANYGTDDGATEVLSAGNRGPAPAGPNHPGPDFAGPAPSGPDYTAPGPDHAAPSASGVPPRHTAVLPDAGDPLASGPQAVPPAGGGAKPPRSKGRLIGLIAAGVVALLVIVLVGSELFIRHRVTSCIEDMTKSATGASDVSVSMSRKPMLLQAASGTAPYIDITVPDNGSANTGLSAHIYLKDIKASGNNEIGSATIVGSMSADGIKQRVGDTLKNAQVSINPDTQQIEIKGDFTAFIISVPVTLKLKPELKNNKLALTSSDTSFFGIGVPNDLAQQVIGAVAVDKLPAPTGLTAHDLKVTRDGVSVTYSGTNVSPAELSSSGNTGGGCSVL